MTKGGRAFKVSRAGAYVIKAAETSPGPVVPLPAPPSYHERKPTAEDRRAARQLLALKRPDLELIDPSTSNQEASK